MAFHFTNYVQETNVWWLRRIRPIWMVGLAMFLTWGSYRYYMYQKIVAQWSLNTPEHIKEERAQLNKRSYGYNSYFQPTLEHSRKKQIMEAQGKEYQHRMPFHEMYMLEKDN